MKAVKEMTMADKRFQLWIFQVSSGADPTRWVESTVFRAAIESFANMRSYSDPFRHAG